MSDDLTKFGELTLCTEHFNYYFSTDECVYCARDEARALLAEAADMLGAVFDAPPSTFDPAVVQRGRDLVKRIQQAMPRASSDAR